jgi:4-diphosphocytidyl-2-C-methyl-D-erythritol kinase
MSQSSTLTVLSPAKLNLFLHITGRREDGYHELQTLFQLLDWGDWLAFTPNRSGRITLDAPGLDIPLADNLVYRAAGLLQKGTLGAHIAIDKRIPAGGGLGGGSSNAATTLLALNHLWQRGLDQAALQAMGATLGADVPVFVAGHSAWAEGIGERLTPVELPERWYLVIIPGCHVSTGQIFSHLELTRDTSPIKMAAFFEGYSRNDCQDLVRRLHPEVDDVLSWLAVFAEPRLTGTGACVFAGFEQEAEARAVLDQLPDQWTAVVARGLNRSPVLAALDRALPQIDPQV